MSEQKRAKKVTKEINRWKVACLSIIGVLLAFIILVGFRINVNREPDYQPSTEDKAGTAVLEVKTDKEKVNQLMDFYLQDFQKDSDIKYSFYLENQALLNGTFKILGHPIDFYLYFDPYVMEDGNVQLKAKSLSIGTLGLPIKEVLKYVASSYDLPSWVEVDASEQTILLRLDQFEMQNGLFAKAEKINLIDDDIQFNVYLPQTAKKEE